MRATLTAAVILLAPVLRGQESDEKQTLDPAAVAKACADADAVFTAKIGNVNPLGQTNSIPASVFGNVTFKDITLLRGAKPTSPTFSYSDRDGATKHMDLTVEGLVLVAARQKGVTVVVPATMANLALAKDGADKK